jgi:CRISPR system Cascade subunit CasC
MSRTIFDIHILQTVPPSNLNRDDTGSPKTAIYGGVRRARVSSQAWKRATRLAFRDVLDTSELGVRTKRIVELLARQIRTIAPELDDQAEELANETLKSVGLKTSAPKKGATEESGYLVFLSVRQIANLAEAAVAAAGTAAGSADGKGDKLADALKAQEVKALADRDHSVDIALFGRMVAEIPDINVDAAAQVAHAISVHPVDNEYDYFTAVDDSKHDVEETGAGMIGTVEFNSATLYRYAALDVDRLQDNLGDAEATRRAVEAFVRAFTTSMPSGKQNTFANRTLPDVVLVKLRQTQPISFVGAFEDPIVEQATSGRVQQAVAQLAGYTVDVENAFGEPAVRSWVVRVGDRTEKAATLGDNVTMNDLVAAVGAEVAGRLAQG